MDLFSFSGETRTQSVPKMRIATVVTSVQICDFGGNGHLWESHNETPCVLAFTKTTMSFRLENEFVNIFCGTELRGFGVG